MEHVLISDSDFTVSGASESRLQDPTTASCGLRITSSGLLLAVAGNIVPGKAPISGVSLHVMALCQMV